MIIGLNRGLLHYGIPKDILSDIKKGRQRLSNI